MDNLLELGYGINNTQEKEKHKIHIYKIYQEGKLDIFYTNDIFVIITAYSYYVSYNFEKNVCDYEMHEIMKYIREEVEGWQEILKNQLLIKKSKR